MSHSSAKLKTSWFPATKIMNRLPFLSQMSDTEKTRFRERATAWFWSMDLNEGVELATALPQARTFLDYHKCYSEERRRTELAKLLKPYADETPSRPTDIPKPEAHTTPVSQAKTDAAPASATTKFTTPAGTTYELDSAGNVVSVAGRRPNHYDEWKGLMPDVLREKVETIKENFMEMNKWRQELERLVAAPAASKEDIARAARLTKNYEARNLNIFAQADICWEELCGKTVSDEVKREEMQEERKIEKEIVKDERGAQPEEKPKKETAETVEQEDKTPDISDHETLATLTIAELRQLEMEEPMLNGYIRRRLDNNQKYIREKIYPEMSEDMRQQAILRAREILAEKGKLSKKVKERLDECNVIYSA